MPVVGVVNQKGGVGKTTTAVNLGAALAQLGERVLLVDADPQGNSTTGFGIDKARLSLSLYDVLLGWAEGEGSVPPDLTQRAIVPVSSNLDVLPGSLDLAGADASLHQAVGKELILSEALEPVKSAYDWVLIDAPPSLGLLTINVLGASDWLLVPMPCEFYALEGLSQLMKTVDLVKKRINPGLAIGRVLLTMHDPRSRLAKQVREEVEAFFGERVSEVVIPRNVRLVEASSFGESAVTLYPTSKGAQAYLEFAREVMGQCPSVC